MDRVSIKTKVFVSFIFIASFLFIQGSSIVTATAAVQPVVSGLSPNSGPAAGGTIVYVSGYGFKNGDGVMFGAVPATKTVVISSSLIMAVSPAETGGVVNVRVALLTVFKKTPISIITVADRFTYIPKYITYVPKSGIYIPKSVLIRKQLSLASPGRFRAVLINNIQPHHGEWGSPITITGIGFVTLGISEVEFTPDPNSQNKNCPNLSVPKNKFINLTDKQITLNEPSILATGQPDPTMCLYDIGTAPAPSTFGANFNDTFLVTPWNGPTPPSIQQIAPDFGPLAGGNTVIIKGFKFNGVLGVSFGPLNPATQFTINSDNEITVTAPPDPMGGGNSPITVQVSVSTHTTTSPIGITASDGSFHIYPQTNYTYQNATTPPSASPGSATPAATNLTSLGITMNMFTGNLCDTPNSAPNCSITGPRIWIYGVSSNWKNTQQYSGHFCINRDPAYVSNNPQATYIDNPLSFLGLDYNYTHPDCKVKFDSQITFAPNPANNDYATGVWLADKIQEGHWNLYFAANDAVTGYTWKWAICDVTVNAVPSSDTSFANLPNSLTIDISPFADIDPYSGSYTGDYIDSTGMLKTFSGWAIPLTSYDPCQHS